jgi:hypothetical protein
MEIEFTEATGDDPMDTLIGQLEARTEYVITFMRALGADMDRDPGTTAFAIVIGSNAENALVVEGGIAGLINGVLEAPVVVADPLRAGDELSYHPGEANLRMADVIVVNKVDSASLQAVEQAFHFQVSFSQGLVVQA